jgi:hypothetical protein
LSITKSHMTRPGFEPGPPRWEAGDKPPELWYGLSLTLHQVPICICTKAAADSDMSDQVQTVAP